MIKYYNSILFTGFMEQYSRKMKVKVLDIESGKLISLLNEIDAKELGILPLERVQITNPKTGHKINTVADKTDTVVEENEIGLFEDVARLLEVKDGATVEVQASDKPKSVQFIKKKMNKGKLNESEIKEIVEDISSNKLSEVEATAFVSAVYINGFELDEIISMTKALVENGNTLVLDVSPVLDKHSIGGTNGRSTMIIVPIIASAGYYIPKTSSRSITSSAGTADAMEVLAPVTLSMEKIKQVVEQTGGCIVWGGAVNLAPADDKIIKIEHPLSLDPEGQVIASVMAKKVSVGSKHVVIDIPIGPDVKIKTKERAEEMALKFLEVGKKFGINVEVMLTNGAEPSGSAFGPALEARHVMEILEGKHFDNLAKKSCELAGALLEMSGSTEPGKGHDKAKEILESGTALEKMREIIKAQGGKIFSSSAVKMAPFMKEIKSRANGRIYKINVRHCITIARIAGAPGDKKAGLLLKVKDGTKVKPEQRLFEIYAENKRKLELAEQFARSVDVIELDKTILQRIS